VESGDFLGFVGERVWRHSVVMLWAQRWEQTGSVAAKPSGGSTSPLEDHAEFLLALIVEQSGRLGTEIDERSISRFRDSRVDYSGTLTFWEAVRGPTQVLHCALCQWLGLVSFAPS